MKIELTVEEVIAVEAAISYSHENGLEFAARKMYPQVADALRSSRQKFVSIRRSLLEESERKLMEHANKLLKEM